MPQVPPRAEALLAHPQLAVLPEDGMDPHSALTEAQLAVVLGVSRQWLALRRLNGDGPPFLKLSPSLIRYRRRDVISWLDNRLHRSTSEYPCHAPVSPGRPRKGG